MKIETRLASLQGKPASRGAVAVPRCTRRVKPGRIVPAGDLYILYRHPFYLSRRERLKIDTDSAPLPPSSSLPPSPLFFFIPGAREIFRCQETAVTGGDSHR